MNITAPVIQISGAAFFYYLMKRHSRLPAYYIAGIAISISSAAAYFVLVLIL